MGSLLLLFYILSFLCVDLLAGAFPPLDSDDITSNYIVHASKSQMPLSFTSHYDWYISTLASVKKLQVWDMIEQHKSMYTYNTVFHGFTARLTPSQAASLNQIPGFTTFQDGALQLHTTHTPEFLNLTTTSGIWPASSFGAEVIVGVLDTGIWPERSSFGDNGLGDIPARWKGKCEEGTAFSASLCNKKLIGARAFYKGYEAASGPINETNEYKSARDSDGHGTHTSSTAAGQYVYNASVLGYAPGTARGIAPRARIAVYKVCWKAGCFSSDVLAAIESAIEDGVDIISISLGSIAQPYYVDTVAIGAFGAMAKGIVVSSSAGNAGPGLLTVSNVAPWILTVAASTVDRDFASPLTLGNGDAYRGVSLYSGKSLGNEQLPLIYAGDVGLNNNASSRLCVEGTLDPQLIENKIVLCDRGVTARVNKGMVVRQAGGTGMILANAAENGEELTADAHLLPASLVGFKAGLAIKAYISNVKNATANIAFDGTQLGIKPAPSVAAFSSRGPNSLNPEILKPDITAPGVNILAAWTGAIGPTGQIGDNRDVDFNIISGTSMSCPHVSGIAALLKGAHPDWSPGAIKSALMTTAFNVDNAGDYLVDDATLSVSTSLSHGAGHVNPEGALNPGLVYDLTVQNYVDFLCGLNYTVTLLEVFTKGQYQCSSTIAPLSGLNYPSFSVVFDQSASSTYFASFRRTVTNVGDPNSVYTVDVSAPLGVNMDVEPQTLIFTENNERLSYDVTFQASAVQISPGKNFEKAFGYLVWKDGAHVVRSPIVFIWLSSRPIF